MNTLDTALALRAMGFAIHWVMPNSKAPVDTGWSTAPMISLDKLKQTYRAGYNVGFRPGKWTVVDGKEIVVLDIDIRGGDGYAEEAYAAASSMMGHGQYEPTVISGSGVGRHQYLALPLHSSPDKAATTLRQSDIYLLNGKKCARNVKGAKPAWLIELLSTGKNVVLPPSIHPDTLKPYAWTKDGALI